jgi:hypothetical protein
MIFLALISAVYLLVLSTFVPVTLPLHTDRFGDRRAVLTDDLAGDEVAGP